MKKDLSIARKVASRTPRDTLNIVLIRPNVNLLLYIPYDASKQANYNNITTVQSRTSDCMRY